MKKRLHFTYILIALAFSHPVSSQTVFHSTEFNEGPLASSINVITQDSTGVLWLGSEEALIRYTGNDVHFIREDPLHSDSLSDSGIMSLLNARDGTLWVGTKNGLNAYNTAQEQNTTYIASVEHSDTLSDNWIQSLTEDGDGNIWVGTAWGLNMVNPQSGEVIRIPVDIDDDHVDLKASITTMGLASDGDLILGTDYGLARFDRTDGGIEYFDLSGHVKSTDKPVGISVIKQYRDHMFLVGTSDGSLFFYNELDNSLYTETWIRELTDRMASPITAIAQEPSGELWFGGWDGLLMISKNRETVTRFVNDTLDPASIPYDSVRSLFLDRSGLLWVGLHDHGVAYINLQERRFNHVYNIPSDSTSLSNNVITSLMLDSRDRLWVGTEYGLNRTNERSKGFERIHLDIENANDYSVSAICEYPENVFWIGTYWSENSGLHRIDGESGMHRVFHSDTSDPGSLSSNNITSIIPGENNTLWIGTSGGGLNRLDIGSMAAKEYRMQSDDPSTIVSDWITTLYIDTRGILWVGSEGGLSKYDNASDSFTRYTKSSPIPRALSNNRIRSIYEDSRGNLWVGTDNGLNLVDRDKDEITMFTRGNGLRCDSIKSITEDESGRLVLGTQQGISFFTIEDGVIHHLNRSNGLPFLNFSASCAFSDESGILYFGGINGLVAFDPDEATISTTPPSLSISDITMLKSSASFGGASASIAELEVPYDENSLSFSFFLSDFFDPRNNRFFFLLEGLSEKWHPVTKGNTISLIDLKPGSYTLKVKGISARGVEAENEVQLPITVVPPFWMTAWFKTLISVSLLLAVVLIYRMRTLSLLNHQKRLEKTVASRTQSLLAQKQELEESKRRYETLVETSPDAIFLSDETGRLLMFNRKMNELIRDVLSTTPDSFNVFEFISHHQVVENTEEEKQIKNADDISAKPVLASLSRDDGDVQWHEINMAVFSAAPETTSVIGVIRDMTDRKKLEEQLEMRQRMESLGTLAGGVAHDFNNLLTGIIGNIGLLELNNGNLTNEQKEYIAEALVSSRQATNLVKKFQSISANPLQNMKRVDLYDVVNNALNSLPQNDISFVNTILEKKFFIFANSDQLTNAIVHIATNSIQAIEMRGNLSEGVIKIHAVESNLKERDIENEHKHGYVHIRFEDNGIGMSSRTRRKAFNPFFSTHTRHNKKGQGLGLSMVYNAITHTHHGMIDIESVENAGTTIHVYLPLAEDVNKAKDFYDAEGSGHETILIIEDEKAIRNTTSKVLRQFGYQVMTAENGPEGIEMYQSNADTIDLVLLDLNMPKMPGSAVLDHLLEIDPDCVVIITSGQSEQDIRKYGRASGFIQKPYSIKGLTEQIRDVFDTYT